jgi:hypothetical protein
LNLQILSLTLYWLDCQFNNPCRSSNIMLARHNNKL